MKLSVLIPAHNEGAAIASTVRELSSRLRAESIPHEILVIDDHSTDDTVRALAQLEAEVPDFRWIGSHDCPGYGYAVGVGLAAFAGDAVCIVMADASDDPNDVVTYYRVLQEGYECVFGSRFMAGARVVNYPRHKLILNRMANLLIGLLFRLGYNDTTNAFKCFRREVIDGVQPILARHFNLTVELPLKAIVRGFSYTVVPTNWYGRTTGESKLRIQEMGSRYLFIVLYVLLEKWLSRGDYRRSKRMKSDSGDVTPIGVTRSQGDEVTQEQPLRHR